MTRIGKWGKSHVPSSFPLWWIMWNTVFNTI